jgi:glycosyltransferase involved in cell wall biosynthesis
MPNTVALIVPCYDEAARLAPADFLGLARRRPDLRLLLVDDGSRDATLQVLESIRRANPEQIDVLALAPNRGKAEAVREGMRVALERGAEVVGYFDADLSTPAAEVARLVEELEDSGAQVVLGSRIRLLGWTVERRPARHYVGRVFATFASLALRLPVYDTQCGAKIFRACPALDAALAAPFTSRWIFDVELLARLLAPPPGVAPLAASELREVPLRTWRDVAGSKLRLRGMVVAGVQLLALLLRSRLRRRPAALPAPAGAIVAETRTPPRSAAG